jgi:hypothetical protein
MYPSFASASSPHLRALLFLFGGFRVGSLFVLGLALSVVLRKVGPCTFDSVFFLVQCMTMKLVEWSCRFELELILPCSTDVVADFVHVTFSTERKEQDGYKFDPSEAHEKFTLDLVVWCPL